jgi:hypothetical protein
MIRDEKELVLGFHCLDKKFTKLLLLGLWQCCNKLDSLPS